jgi:hypothetical protein
MKSYPSIPNANGQSFIEIRDAYIFDKLDGSCMRSEWTSKNGWFKHGRRNGLLDNSNPSLLVVPSLFEKQLAEPLTRIARDNKWKHLVVFYEFWGAKSLGGLHEASDLKFLSLFDAAPNKQGILGPAEFRKQFEDKVNTAKLLEITNFTRGYTQNVRNGNVPGVTFEGVVAKAGHGHNIVRAKAKTQKWIDAVMARYGSEAGRRIVES